MKTTPLWRISPVRGSTVAGPSAKISSTSTAHVMELYLRSRVRRRRQSEGGQEPGETRVDSWVMFFAAFTRGSVTRPRYNSRGAGVGVWGGKQHPWGEKVNAAYEPETIVVHFLPAVETKCCVFECVCLCGGEESEGEQNPN